ncbi:MAG: hypothetical protein DME26_06545 [Verrucomicrobia bacterium]|nr:MAG: hypothetical protein DME26_06545 [Verrucomicrobiota bacterium]
MNRRNSRQVLECGDGVCAVTALAGAALKTPKLTADTVTPTQSGDSEDSVAAVQDASRADWIRPRFMAPMCVHWLEVEALHEPPGTSELSSSSAFDVGG